VRPSDRIGEQQRAARRVRAHRLALACLLLCAAAAEAAAPRDAERLARADALLADKAQWSEAIAAYRDLLAADPEWSAPRLQLARVLAWSGAYDEAIAHFDRLAASAAPPEGLAIERAEVLSWAGRSAEAEAAFQSLLAAQPGDARAARGLARVYRWSGERGRADRWYDASLALEDDAEARREQLAMREELRSELRGVARAFFDSEDVSFLRSEARFARDVDFDTRLFATSAALYVAHDREEGAFMDGEPESDRGFEARLGVERRLGARTRGLLELGGRHWEHGDAQPLARASLELDPNEGTSLGVELSYDDMLERSYSLESVLRDVRRSGGKVSWWSQLTPALEGYAEAGGAWLSDGNEELFAGGSASWRPFAERELRVVLSLDASRYGDYTEVYYSPELDAGATLSLLGRLPIRGPLALTFDAGGGAGLSRELGESEFGPAYHVKAGFSWRREGLSLDLDFARSQSVRAITYTTHEAMLRASWSF
jgi:tetratricopeptide (TPR) repeat protein